MSKHHSNNNHGCNGKKNGVEIDDDDDEEEEEEEDGLIKSSTEKLPSTDFPPARNILFNSNGLSNAGIPMNFDETNANLFQMRVAQMMSSMVHPSNSTPNFSDPNNAMMNTLANIQRNLVLQFLSDPMAAAQAAAAAAAAMSSSPIKANLTPTSSNNKQLGSGRKRKSTPEKRPLTNHPSATTTNNNNNNNNNHGDVRICSLTFR